MEQMFMISKNGIMQPCVEHPELPKGTIIYSFGAGMWEEKWAKTGKGEELVKLSPNCSESYFSHPFHNLDKYCRPISEKFGIGFYYDLNEPLATDEEINQAVERANKFLKEEEEEKKRKEEKWKKAKEEVIKKYDKIFDRPNRGYCTDAALVAKHIRKELSIEFQGQKFSVRKTGYSTIEVSWTDGPTRDEVEQVIGKHQRCCTRDRWNDDIFDYKDTAFTSVFGGVDYLFFYRETAPENRDVSLYTKPIKQVKEEIEPLETSGVQIIDYSERAIAVIGDTKAIKETLKSLGGRFNNRLSCGAGWIFPKSKEESVRKTLSL